MAFAREAAANNAGSDTTLASALEEANERVRDSGIASVALDPPHVAQAFVAVGSAYSKYARTARAKIAGWKNRVARGLWVEGFGADAEAKDSFLPLYCQVLHAYFVLQKGLCYIAN